MTSEQALINSKTTEAIDVLLVTWDGAGNLPPQRSLIRALLGRGHAVRILAPASVEHRITPPGAQFLPHVKAPVRDSLDPASDRLSIRTVTEAPGLIADLADVVRDARPTILLADFFIHQAVGFGRAARLPTFALGQTLYGSVSAGPLPRALEAADRILMFSHRSFDSAPATDDRYIYIGAGRPYDAPSPVAWLPRRPRVLVSLSTSYQQQLPLLQKLCDALADLPVQALVTTGPAICPSLLHCGSNTRPIKFASHDKLLPGADLLVTHGGHGTTLAGAIYGVPMLIVPMGRDQPWVAAEAERLKIARQMDPSATVEALRQAIAEVLNDVDLAGRAKTFSASLPPMEALDSAIATIENFASK